MLTPVTDMTLSLADAIEFINLEADLLDRRDYAAWLDLWTETGLYVIPVDNEAEDFAAVLNYAYDDAHMRQLRVDRFVGGHAISSAPAAKTVRVLGRFRVEETAPGAITVRAAQHLVEYKFETHRLYAADITYKIVATDDGLKLASKVVRLLNAGDALGSLSYLM